MSFSGLHVLGDEHAAQAEAILKLTPIFGINLSPSGWRFVVGSGWNLGAGWTFNNGRALAVSAGAVDMSPLPLIAGAAYRITVDLMAVSVGSVRPQIHPSGTLGAAVSTPGTFRQVLTAAVGDITFRLLGLAGFTGTLRAVDLRRV